MFYRIARIIIMPIVRFFLNPIYIDREKANIITGPAIVVSNHVSLNDPLLLGVLFKRTLHFMAKVELFKNPVFAWVLRGLQAFPVNRDHIDVKSVRNSMNVLKMGGIFAIFPEGTRNLSNELLPLKAGSAFIALKAQVPMIPVYIMRPKRGKRIVIVGDSIDIVSATSRLKKDEAMAEIMRIVGEAFSKLRTKILDIYPL